jgi:hypothetical protein
MRRIGGRLIRTGGTMRPDSLGAAYARGAETAAGIVASGSRDFHDDEYDRSTR